ncbi:GumC family protein [Roseivivax sediminis]|uniref:Uncharacterized protein involved in exopolysaccharide biosynthesis n=1 Tax=Roseivivax sediminis TaxID=936889 RepID=A0A1I1UQ95_9RHOB|nr:chain-length determining protein [Roseivivax sediminis]SFD71818.1 Uncharacterized protein involved in exopolysaccharide biosynthesis [Roseivivax sediminis]
MNQFQSVQEVVAALRRRAFLIVVLIALGCAASVYVAQQQEKIYEATAVVQIEDARIPEQMTGSATLPPSDPARRVRLIEQRLMARDNLLGVMDEHALFEDEPSVNERVFALRQSITLEEIRGNAQPWQTDVVPSGLRIIVRLGDPQVAADVANHLMHSVIAESRSRSEVRAQETLSFFDEEAARVSAEIAEAEARIATFKEENAGSLPEGLVALRDQLAGFEEALLTLDREIIALENNSVRLRAEDLQRQVSQLQDQKSLLEDRIAGLQADLDRAPEVERNLGALERELTQLQERYTIITRRRADAEMAQVLQERDAADRFEVLETALPPEVSISRSKRKVAMAGGVVSVIFALGVAVILELLNPAIRTAAQLERQLGITPVVAIPRIRSRRSAGRRRLLWLGGLVALIAAGAAAARTFGGALLDLGLFGRFLRAGG